MNVSGAKIDGAGRFMGDSFRCSFSQVKVFFGVRMGKAMGSFADDIKNLDKLVALAERYQQLPYGGFLQVGRLGRAGNYKWVLSDGYEVKAEFSTKNVANEALLAAGFKKSHQGQYDGWTVIKHRNRPRVVID